MRRLSVLLLLSMCLTAKAGLAALSAPVLSLATTGVHLSLSWTSVPGAAGYRLFYAPYPYAGPDTIGSIDMEGQTALSVDLWSGAAFYVAIQAFDDEGGNSYSNIKSFFLLAVNYNQAYSAVAAGTWSQSGDTFTTYFTSSTWPDGEGPSTNIALQSPVVTLTETTFEFLNDNDQLMTFHRDRGQAGEIVGTWTMFEEDRDRYVLDIRSDGTVTVTGYGALFQVPYGTMTIDGNYNDWIITYRVYADMDGPECGDSPGLDLREVYLAQDEGFIYLRFILNGNPDPNSGYKFGDASRHIYVGWDGWEGSISYANGFGWPQPDLPASFLHVDGNQFECKFYKSDCVSFWSGLNDLGAWLDRGTETPCRDHIDMPILQFGF